MLASKQVVSAFSKRFYSKIIGIDLGTTNSCVAVMEGDKPRVIANDIGKRTTPSIVAFLEDGNRLVGEKAKRQAVQNSKHTIYKAKRLIGRNFDDSDVKNEQKVTPYEISRGPDGSAYVKARGRSYSPSEIAAIVLTEMKNTAENHLGEKIEGAVITVPAYFNDSQRKATKDAGTIAGIEVKRIINEPTAAALAYGLSGKDGIVAVYDLGGGTFDISILEIKDGVFQVKATNGDTFLGGEDFDNLLVQYILDKFKEEEGIDLSKNTLALQRIREAAEHTKINLSHVTEDEINLPYIYAENGEVKNLEMTITEKQLDDMTRHLVDKTIEPCKKCLKDAGLKAKDIDAVVLVGGMTRMPLVQKTVSDFFGKQPTKSVNPDEVVAMGAAIQGSIIKGEAGDIVMVDVTPLSLGIETLGGVFSRLIPRNTSIPTTKVQTYTTAEDNQTSVTVKVYQGEREIAAKNKLLGEFVLSGIPAAPRGIPQIEVSFSIDQNGIVNVLARDRATGKESNITIQSSSGLSESEIERMKQEAAEFADEDRKRTELVQLKNDVEGTISAVEASLRTLAEDAKKEDNEKAEKLISNIRNAINGDDIELIKSLHDELRALSGKVATEAYRKAASRNSPQK